MTMGRLLMVYFLCFLYSVCAFGTQLPVPETEILPNGLTVAWFDDDRFPLIDVVALVGSGYRDDLPGKSGTARILSSILERELTQVETYGAIPYASVDDDAFTLGVHGVSDDCDKMLESLSKVIVNPSITDDGIKTERLKVIEEWRRGAENPQNLASVLFQRAISSGTSYARGELWNFNEPGKLTRNDFVIFHRANFVPGNTVLMVIGKTDKSAIRKKLLGLFKDWTSFPQKRIWKNYANFGIVAGKSKPLLINRRGQKQVQVRMGFRIPLINEKDHYALVVANSLLGGYYNSHLNTKIRDQLDLTYYIGSSIFYNRDLAVLAVASSVNNESSASLINVINETIRELVKGPITEMELKAAKEYLTGSFPLSMSTPNAVAARWASGQLFKLEPDHLNAFIPGINAVTAEQVQTAIRRHFKNNELVVVLVGDGKKIHYPFRQVELVGLP